MRRSTLLPDLSVPALLDALPMAAALTEGPEHRIRYLNAAFRRFPDLAEDGVTGRPLLELLPPPVEGLAAALAGAYATGRPVHARNVAYCGLSRGTTYWDLTVQPYGSGGQVRGLFLVLQETTAEVEARAASARRDDLLQSLLATEPVAVAVLRGPDLTFEYVNPGYCVLAEREPAAFLGRPFRETCLHCLGEGVVAAAEAVLSSGAPWECPDVRLPPATGGQEPRFASFRLVPTRDHAGAVDGVLLAAWETTELVRTQQVAEERAARLGAILGSMAEGVVLLDPDYQVQYFNETVRRIAPEFGWSGASLEDAIAALAPRDVEGRPLHLHDTPLREIFAGRAVNGFEMIVRSADGRDVVLSASGAPVRSGDRTAGAVLVFRDVTHRREMDRLKDEFIGLVSHELRTPTTTIRAGLNLLGRYGPALQGPLAQVFRDVQEEAARLHGLIEDMLELARLSAGADVTTEPVRLDRTVRAVVEAMGSEVRTHPILLDLPPSLPLVEAEPGHLAQLIRNLVENARKYAPPGTEVVVAATAAEGRVIVSVLDRGPGVPPEERELVFAPFHRGSGAVERAGGVGLGLTVCRRLVEAQGGRIWVEDRPGGGAAFRFSLRAIVDP
ncbi:MAG TPA: PAS domain-containing protein [Dehalococcoidia bacterium]